MPWCHIVVHFEVKMSRFTAVSKWHNTCLWLCEFAPQSF